jgi:hypothetical protein
MKLVKQPKKITVKIKRWMYIYNDGMGGIYVSPSYLTKEKALETFQSDRAKRNCLFNATIEIEVLDFGTGEYFSTDGCF